MPPSARLMFYCNHSSTSIRIRGMAGYTRVCARAERALCAELIVQIARYAPDGAAVVAGLAPTCKAWQLALQGEEAAAAWREWCARRFPRVVDLVSLLGAPSSSSQWRALYRAQLDAEVMVQPADARSDEPTLADFPVTVELFSDEEVVAPPDKPIASVTGKLLRGDDGCCYMRLWGKGNRPACFHYVFGEGQQFDGDRDPCPYGSTFNPANLQFGPGYLDHLDLRVEARVSRRSPKDGSIQTLQLGVASGVKEATANCDDPLEIDITMNSAPMPEKRASLSRHEVCNRNIEGYAMSANLMFEPRLDIYREGCVVDSMFIVTDDPHETTSWLTTEALLAYFRDVAPWAD